jgi:hypothetical protein
MAITHQLNRPEIKRIVFPFHNQCPCIVDLLEIEGRLMMRILRTTKYKFFLSTNILKHHPSNILRYEFASRRGIDEENTCNQIKEAVI